MHGESASGSCEAIGSNHLEDLPILGMCGALAVGNAVWSVLPNLDMDDSSGNSDAVWDNGPTGLPNLDMGDSGSCGIPAVGGS